MKECDIKKNGPADLQRLARLFPEPKRRLAVLVLYDTHETHIKTTREYLESFAQHSCHHISYAGATLQDPCLFDINAFDVVILHYSVRLSLDWYISTPFVDSLSAYKGLKVLIIQDEYEGTERARKWIEQLDINIVLTCVPPEYVDRVYPQARFPNTCFAQVLTGYVPNQIKDPATLKPFSERKIDIGYRGRPLPYYYGALAREKFTIGQKTRELCMGSDLSLDIEWENEKRIYGNAWYEFIENCRATLGTESGANIFDDYGIIKNNVNKALAEDPTLTYEDIHTKYLAEHEGEVLMNQISARIFEAIAYKTALILFEGTYSGIIQPDVHYIPLKKDFSNLDDVLSKLKDDEYLKQMIDRAYTDIVLSGQYSYAYFMSQLDRLIAGKSAEIGKTDEEIVRALNKTASISIDSKVNPAFAQSNMDDLITLLYNIDAKQVLKKIGIIMLRDLRSIQFPGREYVKKLLTITGIIK